MYKFKEGDKVRVVKKCEEGSLCNYGEKWEAIWNEKMSKYILSKEVGIVDKQPTHSNVGIRVNMEDDFWYFPSDALELIEDNVQKTLADEKDIGVGDIIECVDKGLRWWTVGKHYEVVEVTQSGDVAVIDDYGDNPDIPLQSFKLVSKAAPKELQPSVKPVVEESVVTSEDTLESFIAECSMYFDEVSIYIDKPEDKIEYTLQIDGYKFVGTKEYVVSKMKGAIEWMKP